jgi:hypothetical protein
MDNLQDRKPVQSEACSIESLFNRKPVGLVHSEVLALAPCNLSLVDCELRLLERVAKLPAAGPDRGQPTGAQADKQAHG